MEQQLNRCVVHFITTLTDIQSCMACSMEVAALSLRCVNDLFAITAPAIFKREGSMLIGYDSQCSWCSAWLYLTRCSCCRYGSRLLTTQKHALIEVLHSDALGGRRAVTFNYGVHRIGTGILHGSKNTIGGECFHGPGGPGRHKTAIVNFSVPGIGVWSVVPFSNHDG